MLAVRPLLSLALLGLLALGLTGAAEARIERETAAAPQGLKAFLLRTDERVKHEFDRTPSFAWRPVRGALRYEFELATSRSFTESSIVWSNANDELAEETPATATTGSGTTPGGTSGTGGTTETAAEKAKKVYENLRSPAVSIDVALPWITGSPYALYAHVRAITKDGVTSWSRPFGFNIRWSSIPRDLDSPHPGLFRWSPVEGATAYQVWLFGAKKTFMTTTNVADARDLYTFHRGNPFYTSSLAFRVRAQRTLYGEVVSGLPATTWGPWSPIYTDVQPPLSLGPLWNVATVSDVQSDSSADRAHSLTPGFVFGGDRGGPMDFAGGAPAELYRVYVATDRDCVNIVFRGAVVGSPAYAPRTTGPLALPTDSAAIAAARGAALDFGGEGQALMLDGTESKTNEDTSTSAGTSTGSTGGTGSETAGATSKPAAKVDLPDTAWPTGGYYWTVVPVVAQLRSGATAPLPGATFPIEYRETELPQDACQSGRVMRFGKATPPVVTTSSRPFASGLSPKGRLISATRSKPSFYGTPLVAWQSVLGAQEYEVQWSPSANPWRPVGSLKTPATSSLLPLEPGTWYYRVRGYNHSLLKRPQMAWSAPTGLKVAKPMFSVLKGGR
jgi:hypothetical protein